MQWRRRRVQRAIGRLTSQIAAQREEIALTQAQVGYLRSDADYASTDAVVRPSSATQQEDGRAQAAHDAHQRLMTDQQARLDRLQRRRDELLESLARA